jgi:Na+/melibiose symporter-like transporter
MSKSAIAYGAAALVLIVFPLIVGIWSGASAIIAILLIGVAVYALAVCLLIACFWHRHRYGSWPIEIEEDPTVPRRYPFSTGSLTESGGLAKGSESDDGHERGVRYRVSHSVQGWLRRFSSHV